MKELGLPRAIISMKDYLYGAAVLRLERSTTVTRILSLDSSVVGNQLATVFYLVFIRIQHFSFN